MLLLRSSLAVAAERGALIRIVADGGVKVDFLEVSIATLVGGEEGELIARRVRVLRGTEQSAFIHAKLILVDGVRGYLGSANLTLGGLERNFELGIELEASQVSALEQMIAVFESRGILRDYPSESLRT